MVRLCRKSWQARDLFRQAALVEIQKEKWTLEAISVAVSESLQGFEAEQRLSL